MNDVIGGRYRRISAIQTTGSGSARWCMAEDDGKRYFVKQFLAPVYPVRADTPLGQRQMERCSSFECKKQDLYRALSCVIGETLVPVVDFFRSEGHYYAVSEAVAETHMTAEQAWLLPEMQKRKVLYDLALCLQRMHMQGIVHADLKPEHVILTQTAEGIRTQLIDVDSGFLVEEPPHNAQTIEGDPVYLAPEVFLKMIGVETVLSTQVDVFAFGALIHWIWNGRLPAFDTQKYHYLYEAALDDGEMLLALPQEWEMTVRRMLHAVPEKRPSDAEVVSLFVSARTKKARAVSRNGLNCLMKAE